MMRQLNTARTDLDRSAHQAKIIPFPTGRKPLYRTFQPFTPSNALSRQESVPLASQPGRNQLLKQTRLKLSLTQQMLADFAQVGHATIQRAERGQALRVDTIYQICQFFSDRFGREVTAEELGLLPEVHS